MSIFLISKFKMSTDRLQLVSDSGRLDAVPPEAFSQRQSQGAIDARWLISWIVHGTLDGSIVGQKEVVDRRDMEECLECGVDEAGVAQVEHTDTHRTLMTIPDHDWLWRKWSGLWIKNEHLSEKFEKKILNLEQDG